MKKIIYSFLFILVFNCNVNAQLVTGKNVGLTNTEAGQVSGYIDDGIYTYKGIPYGSAKRFQAAQKVKPWKGIRSSLTYGQVAPVLPATRKVSDESKFFFDGDQGRTGEDCLVLNIWTPSINDEKKKPVMFWIHGGGYTSGSSQELPSYDGENLARKGDVVVVSVNHRLNILGFLDLSEHGEAYKYSANNSILDLRVALEWVRDNIENFGGDPNNVTIFGQSGGGAKVNNLMSMPSAKGLFHKAVNQSGAWRMSMPDKGTTHEITQEVLKELNLNEDEVEELVTMPYLKLANAGQKALKRVENRMRKKGLKVDRVIGLSWNPSVDGDLLPYQTLSKEALELSKNIPLIIGTTKNEWAPTVMLRLDVPTEERAKGMIKFRLGDKTDSYVAALKKAFPDNMAPSDLLDIDMRYRLGALIQAEKKSMVKEGAPVYTYLFSWQSPVLDGRYKAFHCMEIPFIFDNIERCKNMTGGGITAQALSEKMSDAWISFARTGNPNHHKLPKWDPFTVEKGATFIFDNKCEIKYHHDQEAINIIRPE